MLGLVGVKVIDWSTAAVTVSAAGGEVTESKLAKTSVEPTLTAVARPRDPALLLIVATAGAAVVQVAKVVMS